MQQRKKFYSCALKETIKNLQQAKAFINFYCYQKENISKIILEKRMTKRKQKAAVLDRGRANFRGPRGFEIKTKAKDLTLEAKDFKNCSQGLRRPRGRHL